MIVNYDDGEESFNINVNEELYERLKITNGPGRIAFNFVIEDTKTKIQTVISSRFIHLPN